ncbi:MAG: lysophospholipid acyltransferase family protein [Halieaceae bacterium]|nr:lysophospholipid acyltransferase family protein [Halieaceae bacterium]
MGMMDRDNDPINGDALDQHIERALAVGRPGSMFYLAYPLIRRLLRAELVNARNLPDEPCLFIGNHSLFATDGMIFAPLMWHEHGRFLRGLGDKALWNPYSEEFLLAQGAVIGHPQVCSALMEAGHDLMVFPGGAHEATKTQAQRYTLQWKDRAGFVRMAAEHGYTILPCAHVGPDEFYEHWVEGRDIPDTWLGELLARAGLLTDNTRPDLLPPVPLGALGTPFPKPQRCYIQFGEPLNLATYRGKRLSKKALLGIRDEVAGQIEAMLPELFALRDEGRNSQGWLRRLLTTELLTDTRESAR